MNFIETEIFQKQKNRVKNLLPSIGIEQVRKEIISGLLAERPHISSKYFYDEKGSKLFEQITELAEYYPTRTEKRIIENMAPEIMNRHSSFEIIELGSGDCSKISIFINAIDTTRLSEVNYIPVDFSQSAIEQSADKLSETFPQLSINAYVADFIHQIDVIPHGNKPRIICFLGSTIGNFSMTDAKAIIQNLANGVLPGDSLLVGFDMVKDESVLHAAYNDADDVTTDFNKNILNVVNNLIDSDFCLSDFKHCAFYNQTKMRIEMHLEARKDIVVNSPFLEKPIQFKKGHTIHTENSHKFNSDKILEVIENSGLQILNSYTDTNNWFALIEFGKK